MQPIQVTEHEAGTEAGGVPVLKIEVNFDDIAAELFFGEEELAVVVEVVNADLEAMVSEPGAKGRGDGVVAFGNEVKAGAEAEFHLQFCQFPDLCQARWSLNIVREDEGELFAVGPTRPIGRRFLGTGRDGPFVQGLLAYSDRKPAADGHPGRGRKQRLELVIEAVAKHSKQKLKC